jgi:hypothetical protein
MQGPCLSSFGLEEEVNNNNSEFAGRRNQGAIDREKESSLHRYQRIGSFCSCAQKHKSRVSRNCCAAGSERWSQFELTHTTGEVRNNNHAQPG